MSLNLDSLKKSVESLRRAIVAEKNAVLLDDDTKETLRAGVIQNFEVAYEQCWKMMQRWLKENRSLDEAQNPRTRKDLFRFAAKNGLVEDPLPWFAYGEARNLTSHTYDEKKALSVFKTAEHFLGNAQYLLQQLETLND